MRYIYRWFYRSRDSRIGPALIVCSLTAFTGTTRSVEAQTPVTTTMPVAKSPTTAFSFSFFGTLLPAAVGYSLASTGSVSGAELLLFSFGVFAGPGLGHIYAGNSERALTGAVWRGGILLATTLVLTQTGICLEGCEPGEELVSTVFALAGMAGMMISAVADISSAPGSARRYNSEHGLVLGLRPWISAAAGRVGLTAQLTF